MQLIVHALQIQCRSHDHGILGQRWDSCVHWLGGVCVCVCVCESVGVGVGVGWGKDFICSYVLCIYHHFLHDCTNFMTLNSKFKTPPEVSLGVKINITSS